MRVLLAVVEEVGTAGTARTAIAVGARRQRIEAIFRIKRAGLAGIIFHLGNGPSSHYRFTILISFFNATVVFVFIPLIQQYIGSIIFPCTNLVRRAKIPIEIVSFAIALHHIIDAFESEFRCRSKMVLIALVNTGDKVQKSFRIPVQQILTRHRVPIFCHRIIHDVLEIADFRLDIHILGSFRKLVCIPEARLHCPNVRRIINTAFFNIVTPRQVSFYQHRLEVHQEH